MPFGSFEIIVPDAMKLRSARQVATFLLAVFMTVGLNLSAVQASDMTVQMAMTAEMTAYDGGNCQDCTNTGEGHGTQALCPTTACAAPILAVLPHVPATAIATAPAPSLRPSAQMTGWAFLPDPYPPRGDTLM
ncbi:hypothetical protein [Chelativorans salis]|uniref:Uncharacterized protein n=1 Tax=Chelativorans salis TaxID=2978478 RepID=A0ABT2LMB8_9HYPH|nr:hypothetical protein [Chelativorans sp. EGI FJ00035]MCT7375587.1 hypothetical protein [Chelativorans sp. EGI FJ00035]